MRPRVIPLLLLSGHDLVKTRGFRRPLYIGDPIVAVKIFNDREADELLLLDIGAFRHTRGPDTSYLADLASEAFMPITYGGGISTFEQASALFSIGVEKIVLGTCAWSKPDLIQEIARAFGSQAIVVSVDFKRDLFGRTLAFTNSGRVNTRMDPVSFAKRAVELGAGELLAHAIERDGEMVGYNIDITRAIAEGVTVPVISCGGAGSYADFGRALREGKATAVAAGSVFVYHGPHHAVLISYPSAEELALLNL